MGQIIFVYFKPFSFQERGDMDPSGILITTCPRITPILIFCLYCSALTYTHSHCKQKTPITPWMLQYSPASLPPPSQTTNKTPLAVSLVPTNSRVKMMTSWYTPCPRMFFIMVREMSGLFLPYGFRSSRASVGGSVARARDANVSIMRFTHNICTAFRGESYTERHRHRNLILEKLIFHSSNTCSPKFTVI